MLHELENPHLLSGVELSQLDHQMSEGWLGSSDSLIQSVVAPLARIVGPGSSFKC